MKRRKFAQTLAGTAAGLALGDPRAGSADYPNAESVVGEGWDPAELARMKEDGYIKALIQAVNSEV